VIALDETEQALLARSYIRRKRFEARLQIGSILEALTEHLPEPDQGGARRSRDRTPSRRPQGRPTPEARPVRKTADELLGSMGLTIT
jgi:hypothetical protein